MSAVLLRFCLKCGLTAPNTIWKQDRRFMESIIRFWERRVRARIACMFIQVFDNLPNTTLLIELSLNANPSTASYKVCGNAGAERGFNKVTESHKYQFEPAFGRILMAFLHVDGIRPKVPVQRSLPRHHAHYPGVGKAYTTKRLHSKFPKTIGSTLHELTLKLELFFVMNWYDECDKVPSVLMYSNSNRFGVLFQSVFKNGSKNGCPFLKRISVFKTDIRFWISQSVLKTDPKTDIETSETVGNWALRGHARHQ